MVVVSLSLSMFVVYFCVASVGVPYSEFGARCVVHVVHAYCVLCVVNWLVVFRALCFCCFGVGCSVFAVCRLPFAVCRLPFGVCCLLFVVRRLVCSVVG